MAAGCVAVMGSNRMFLDENFQNLPLLLPLPLPYSSPENLDLMSWQKTHPELWSSHDVLNLIYHIAARCREFNISQLNGENFQDVSGKDLYVMTKENFLERDPRHGGMLHDLIQDLIRKSQFEPPTTASVGDDVMFPKLEKLEHEFSSSFTDDKAASFNIAGYQYEYDSDDYVDLSVIQPSKLTFPDCAATRSDNFRFGTTYTSEYDSTTQSDGGRLPRHFSSNDEPYWDEPIDLRVNTSNNSSNTTTTTTTSSTTTTIRSMPTSHMTYQTLWPVLPTSQPTIPVPVSTLDWSTPPTSTDTDWKQINSSPNWSTQPNTATDWPKPANFADWPKPVPCGEWPARIVSRLQSKPADEDPKVLKIYDPESISQQSPSPANGKHLWEFICRLLKESESILSNRDRFIRWEDREQGVFRICDSKKVAKLWGCEKHNERMTYEKLSRALRWSRAYGYLADLPTTRRYPKKLCFRFGPRALNWKEFCTQ